MSMATGSSYFPAILHMLSAFCCDDRMGRTALFLPMRTPTWPPHPSPSCPLGSSLSLAPPGECLVGAVFLNSTQIQLLQCFQYLPSCLTGVTSPANRAFPFTGEDFIHHALRNALFTLHPLSWFRMMNGHTLGVLLFTTNSFDHSPVK